MVNLRGKKGKKCPFVSYSLSAVATTSDGARPLAPEPGLPGWPFLLPGLSGAFDICDWTLMSVLFPKSTRDSFWGIASPPLSTLLLGEVVSNTHLPSVEATGPVETPASIFPLCTCSEQGRVWNLSPAIQTCVLRC